MAGVNLVCLTITLLYPNPATPFSLLPILVGVTTWIFLDKRVLTKLEQIAILAYLVVVTIFGALCVTLGVTARIQNASFESASTEILSNLYEVHVINEVALLGGKIYDYRLIVLSLGVPIALLIIFEVITAFWTAKSDAKDTTNNISIDYIARQTIGVKYTKKESK